MSSVISPETYRLVFIGDGWLSEVRESRTNIGRVGLGDRRIETEFPLVTQDG